MDNLPPAEKSEGEGAGATIYTPYEQTSQPEGEKITAYNPPGSMGEGPRRNLVVIGIAGALVGAVVMALVLWGAGLFGKPGAAAPPLVEGTKVGNLAPDFSLESVETGEKVSLKDLRGRPVWVNFWATWCPPCRDEMPEMQRLYEEHRARGLEIVGIDVQESAEQAGAFTKELGLTWQFVLDKDGKTTDRYLVSGLPTHYFIDREGVIQAVHIGGLETIVGVKAPVDEYLEKIIGR